MTVESVVQSIATHKNFKYKDYDPHAWGIARAGRPLIIIDKDDMQVCSYYKNLDSAVAKMLKWMMSHPSEDWLGIWHRDYGIFIGDIRRLEPDAHRRVFRISIGTRVWKETVR